VKSSYSGFQGNCIDVDWTNGDPQSGTIRITETDEPELVIYTSPEKFTAFVKGVKDGEFDHFLPPRADGGSS
jgi:hypothetical protein